MVSNKQNNNKYKEIKNGTVWCQAHQKAKVKLSTGGRSTRVSRQLLLSLNYDTCITNTIKKANYKRWLLAKLRYYMTESMAIKIYNSMILPYFDYGDIIYMGGNANLLNKLQVLQNRALKVCLQVYTRFPTIELHIKCNTKLLTSRRELHLKLFSQYYTT